MPQQIPGDSTIHFGVAESTPELCSSFECVLWSFLTDPVVLIAGVLTALLFVQGLVILRAAEGRCREERRRTRAEADALAEFAERVSHVAPVRSVQTSVTPTETLVDISRGDGLQEIERAYRETVMSVPHYDEEYGEPFHENVVEEFGPDTAAALESNQAVTAVLQRTLLTKSQQSRRDREAFAEALSAELGELETVRRRLTAIERARARLSAGITDGGIPKRSFEELLTAWNELSDLEAELDEVVEDRQASLADPPYETNDWAPSFYEYLYEPLKEASYPILAQTLELVEQVRDERQVIVRGLARHY